MRALRKLLCDRGGATAIEYGLIAALISVAAIAAMQGIGGQLKTSFSSTSSSMTAAAG
jgi:pilus assembly protein Flp/PilA